MAIDEGAFTPGLPVLDSGGRKVGTLVGATERTLTIETGRFGKREVVVPVEAVSRRADGYLLEGELEAFERDPGLPLGGEDLSLALHEEELVAQKHPVVRGHLRLRKRVVIEKRTVTVEIRREEVRIEHVAATASPAPEPLETLEAHPVLGAPLQEHDGWMPLYDEEVQLVLRPRVREWIHLHKELVGTPRTFTAKVKREVAEVDADRTIVDDVHH